MRESPTVRILVPLIGIAVMLWMAARALSAPPTNGERAFNELGAIMILEYHRIGDPERRWTRTPAGLRRDLELLWENGYRPISLGALIAGSIALPAGSSPVVVTFDDSSPGQFRYIGSSACPHPSGARLRTSATMRATTSGCASAAVSPTSSGDSAGSQAHPPGDSRMAHLTPWLPRVSRPAHQPRR